jgi:cytochrome c-type biogenesis protein CcmH/NrfG
MVVGHLAAASHSQPPIGQGGWLATLHSMVKPKRRRAPSSMRATELLDRVVAMRPDNWNTMWMLGTARQPLENHEQAYDAFGRAYALDPPNSKVARKLFNECIVLEKGR